MTTARILTIASLGVVLSSQPLYAQSLSQYRAYTLEGTVASIVKSSGARDADLKTLHERPARIQELEWRAPYVPTANSAADPVRNVLFSFYDGLLYRVVVTYERDRMEGLTDDDVIQAISTAYGVLPMQARAADSLPMEMAADTTVIARWDDGASVLSLLRGGHAREFRLVLASKQLSARARTAVKEAVRLDTKEAPQRELTRRQKEVADAVVSKEKARVTNKAAFRP